MTKISGRHHQVTAVAIQVLPEGILRGPTSPIEVYSCKLHVLDLVGDGLQVTFMTADDCCQGQRADPVLGLMILRMQDGTLTRSPCTPMDPPKPCQFLWECNHLKLKQGILYRKPLLKDSQEAQFQLVLLTTHWETALRGCNNNISHLGLKCMLNLMHSQFF